MNPLALSDDALGRELAERTLELCRIPSVIGHEGALADHVERWAQRHFPADELFRIGHTLVLGRPRRDARPTVGLFGHLDTVPPHPGDPEPHLDGEQLVGLGASDMKGALALMMCLAETPPLADAPFNLVYVFYEREEGPYAENGLGPLFEARPDLNGLDFGICLEPSDNAIQMGCCGALHATLEFVGKSAHSARPWQGANAVHLAGPLLTELLNRSPNVVELQGHTFREVMSVTLANGGRARNVVPERFTLNLNYRFAPNRTLEEAKAEVLALVAGRANVTFTDLSPAGPVFANHPILQRLQERTGAVVESKQAWTDVARLWLHGIPAVNFGPGESAQAHQAREKVPVARLVEGLRLFGRFLESP
jgi:succinyl-diaminopimelate desuccinylase